MKVFIIILIVDFVIASLYSILNEIFDYTAVKKLEKEGYDTSLLETSWKQVVQTFLLGLVPVLNIMLIVFLLTHRDFLYHRAKCLISLGTVLKYDAENGDKNE